MADDRTERAQQLAFDAVLRNALAVERNNRGLVADMNDVVGNAGRTLGMELLERLDNLTPGELRTLSRYRSGQRVDRLPTRVQGVVKFLDEWAASLGTTIMSTWQDGAIEFTQSESDFIVDLMRETLVDAPTAAVSAAAIYQQAMETPALGTFIEDALKEVESETKARIISRIREGVSQGETNEQIVRALRGTKTMNYSDGVLKTTRNNLQTIVRTGRTHLSNITYDETYQALGVEQVVFVATIDGRTTLQCFPGSTEVVPLGSIRRIFRRWYEGEMVVITTSGANEIECTPNHPVLTSHGWLPANEVKPGKHVVYSVSGYSAGVSGVEGVGVPTKFADLFDAAAKLPGVEVVTKSASAEEFHGDIVGVDNKVDILSSDRDLSPMLNSVISEEFGKSLFGIRQNGAPLFGDGLGSELLNTGLPVTKAPKVDATSTKDLIEPALTSIPGEVSEDIAWSHAFIKELKSSPFVIPDMDVALSSLEMWHSAKLLKQACNSGGGDAVMPTNGSGRSAAPIVAQDVISVRSEYRACHVYNLESSQETYIAGGIIVHNCSDLDSNTYDVGSNYPRPPLHYGCRSIIAPYFGGRIAGNRPYVKAFKPIRQIPKDKRPDNMVGQVRASTSMTDFLKRSDNAAFAREYFGPTRYKLFQEGKISISQMIRADGTKYTIAELRQRHAKDFREVFGEAS